MIDDLDRVVRLREHRKAVALQRMLADRRAAEASAEAARCADLRLQHGIAQKALHWSATTDALQGDDCRIDGMRAAASWSGELDRRIARLAGERQRADADAVRRDAVLAQSRAAHGTAARGVEKAERLRDSEQSLARRADESRQDAVAEEFAVQRWNAVRTTRRTIG